MLIVITEILQSPPGPSAADRFSSPSPGSAKRRLFGGASVTGTVTSMTQTSTNSDGNQTVIAFQQAQTEDGRQVRNVLSFTHVCMSVHPAVDFCSIT